MIPTYGYGPGGALPTYGYGPQIIVVPVAEFGALLIVPFDDFILTVLASAFNLVVLEAEPMVGQPDGDETTVQVEPADFDVLVPPDAHVIVVPPDNDPVLE